MSVLRLLPLTLLLALGACPGPDPRAAGPLGPDDAPAGVLGDAGVGSTSPGDAGSGTGSLDDGGAEDAGAAPRLACQRDEKRCDGDLPQVCDDVGVWHDGMPCAVEAPVCNSGLCSRFQLRGGLDAFGPRPATSNLRLKNDGLVSRPRLCGSSICVTGGITP